MTGKISAGLLDQLASTLTTQLPGLQQMSKYFFLYLQFVNSKYSRTSKARTGLGP